MILNLKLVRIDSDYLRKFDKRVIYNMDNREIRPFIVVLFKINNYEYYAPLSSPKPKHLKMRNTIAFFN